MKKIIAIAIIATVAAFAAACANTGNTNTNTANATSNQNAANANSANSSSMHGGEGDDRRMNMTNGNHSQMGDQHRNDGMRMGNQQMRRGMPGDANPNTNNNRDSNRK